MPKKGNWTEKDEATITAIIVNMMNQRDMFKDLGEKSELPQSFEVENNRDFVLGLYTGIVINLFANYWIGEHEAGLHPEDLSYLYHKISLSGDLIKKGLFE